MKRQTFSFHIAMLFLMVAANMATAAYGNDLYFDGSTTHVVVPHSDVFNFQGDFTIEVWLNVESLADLEQNRDVIYCHESHIDDEGSWGMVIMGPPNPVGVIKFLVWNADEGNGVTCETRAGTIEPTGEQCEPWYHVAFVYNAVSYDWTFFVNGQIASSGNDYLPIGITTRDLTIGWETNEWWGWHSFNGWMTEIRISSIPRYTTPFVPSYQLGSDENTIAYWDFHEGSGVTLTDLSGNGHHGTIVDGTWVDSCPPVSTLDSSWSAIKHLF